MLDKLSPVANGIKKVGEASAKLAVGGVKVVGTAVQGAGKALGLYSLAAGAAGTALAAFGIKGVKTASDLSEVENVVNKTFGEAGAGKIDVWAKQAAVSFGLSELSAKKMNGTMGAMLKSTGLTEREVLDMSTSLTGLAGDMASFYNLDSEEAFNKLRSGISGETEPLKQLGINMSQANLAAFALTQGIKKPIASMSQAELATLRYNYILQATKDVQGDFASTSGGLANQLRIAKLQVENIASSFGQALLPSVTSTLQGMNGLINEAMPALTGTFTGLAEVMTGTEGASAKFSDNLEDLIGLISGKVSEVLPDIINVLALSLPTLLEGFNTVLIALISSVGEALPGLINALMPALLGAGSIRLLNSSVELGYLSIQTVGPTGPWLTAAAGATTINLAKVVGSSLYTAYKIDWGSTGSTSATHNFWGTTSFNGHPISCGALTSGAISAGGVVSCWRVEPHLDNNDRCGTTTKRWQAVHALEGYFNKLTIGTNTCWAAGTMSLTTASWTTVSFGKTFPSAPRVFGQYTHDFTGDIGMLKIRNITTTSFQATIGGSGFSGIAANWFAILV